MADPIPSENEEPQAAFEFESLAKATDAFAELSAKLETSEAASQALLDEAQTKLGAANMRVTELTAESETLSAMILDRDATIAKMEEEKTTAEAEAAKIAASVGVEPLDTTPDPEASGITDVREKFQSLKGIEKSRFYQEHKAEIHAQFAR